MNIARAKVEGAEVELGVRPTDRFSVWGNYTYLKARDLTNARDLARRPRNTVSVGADWRTPLHDFTIGGDLRLVSDTVDYDFFGTVLPIASHLVATVRASLPVTERVELYGRVENIGDERYQSVYGYNTAGRSAFIGARVKY